MFGALPIADQVTLFDCKYLSDTQPLFWDDQQVSGSGTSSVFSAASAGVVMSVGAAAGRRVRQTWMSIPYEPGKTRRHLATGTFPDPATGATVYAGQLTDNNGFAWGVKSGSFGVLLRSGGVDTFVPRAQWNLAQPTINPSTMQIFVTDFVWQGAGPVRFGLLVGNEVVWVHQLRSANIAALPYTLNPQLPLRRELSSGGSAASMLQVCDVVTSLGGYTPRGAVRSAFSGPTVTLTAGTIYGLIGIRLNASYLRWAVEVLRTEVFFTSPDNVRWSLRLAPTVTGVPVFSQIGALDVATPTDGSITIGGGTLIDVGFAGAQVRGAVSEPTNDVRIGSSIAGVAQQLWLCGAPIANMQLYSSLTWQEFG